MTFVGAGLEAWGGVCWGAARLEGPGQGLRRGLEGPVRPSQTSLDGAEEEPPGELWGGGMQSSRQDSWAAFCLKREKSKEKLRVSFKAFELIPWGENRESQGEAGLRSERDGAFGIRKLDVKIVHCDGIRTHQNTTCKVGY